MALTERKRKYPSLTAGQKEMTRAALRRIVVEDLVARLNRLEIQVATWQRRENERAAAMRKAS